MLTASMPEWSFAQLALAVDQ
ncbi:hypothetical protein [Devosia subaequoris]